MSEAVALLRFEGPLQAWGDHRSKFRVRYTYDAPTKSGVIGLLCAALGVSRRQADEEWLSKLNTLLMGVRVDRPGLTSWDYQTIGAGLGLVQANGQIKRQTLLSRREYLCDASFLVALQGEETLIREIQYALEKPVWPPYLGRKSCPPSVPVLEPQQGEFVHLMDALRSVPWRRRHSDDETPEKLDIWLDKEAFSSNCPISFKETVWFDVPVSFELPSHKPRIVLFTRIPLGGEDGIPIATSPLQSEVPDPPRNRADYTNTAFRKCRQIRMAADHNLCVFCKEPADSVHHVTYDRAGGNEVPADLRSLCRLCHDAITMLEYGFNLTSQRIDPEDDFWRQKILQKRNEIISFRSLTNRRRAFKEFW